MKRIIAAISFAFTLSACALDKIDMVPGFTQGQYRVASVEIKPVDEKTGQDREYIDARNRLIPRIEKALENKGSAPDINVVITIYDVSMEINAARAIMIGDNFRISSMVTLIDAATGKEIGKTGVYAQFGGESGAFAIFGDIQYTAEQQQEMMLNAYVLQLMAKLYPRK